MPNDFTNDDSCVALYTWEDGASFLLDQKGGNDLSNDGVVSDADEKEGTYSALFTAAGQDYCGIVDASLDAGFPCKKDSGVFDFSFCSWFKLTSLPAASNFRNIVWKYLPNNLQFMITCYNDAGNTKLNFGVSSNGTSWTGGVLHASALAINTWYHLGVTWNNATKAYRVRIWDDTAGAILGSDAAGNFGAGIANLAGNVNFGYPSAGNTMDGRMDESIFFNTSLSQAKIDRIRAGTYSGVITATALGSIEFTAAAIAHNYNLATASGSIEVTATASAKVLKTCTASGAVEFIGTAIARNYCLATAPGSIEFTAAAIAHNYNLATAAGAVEFTASAVGKVLKTCTASGSFDFTATAEGENYNLALCVGSVEFTATATAKCLKTGTATGAVEVVGTAKGALGYALMTPAMHASLIDPRSGGAWLWLAEVKLPGYSIIRIARNGKDEIYSGNVFSANNFESTIPKLTSDGSVPRTTIRIAQDAAYTFENRINALQGKLSEGYVRLIRAHPDFLDKFVEENEYFSHILMAKSDWQWVTLTLGMPNPLRRMIPLRVYSAKMCPWATPELFKGPECQYAGPLTSCGGLREDCEDRGNEEHWGGELGLMRRS